ncbi:MAG TPA: polysaccharide biosynthesis C-terminal domain-containing protein, partial [Smithellaceae bacterium]|nr:polysaccharide biosynthesis C-terminal domain-containing protein [Smithellaceae bacterium]
SIGLNVLINVPFIYTWGAIGAAWGTLLAGLISGTISFIVSQKYYKIGWEYEKVGLIFLIFFGSAITMIVLRYFDISYLIRIGVKLISLAGYAYLGMKLNILSRNNYLLVKNMFMPARVAS